MVFYLLAAVLFIFGLKGLTHPRTAVRGNFLGALGMLTAIVTALVGERIISPWLIVAGLVLGAGLGTTLAVKIQMTAMPQLVALFNGFGGLASLLVAGAELGHYGASANTQMAAATAAAGLIGAVTLWGSLVAFGKLQGLISEKPVIFALRHPVNILLGLAAILLVALVIANPGSIGLYWLLVLAASALGILLVTPIGGADMPVVIALLNSYSGLAAAATGFVLGNTVLIIAGSLVGASGIILTLIMCKAMNRSIRNVLFGVLAPAEEKGDEEDIYAGRVTSSSPEEVAMLFDTARRVVIVPGYGLAVAQAQHAVRDFAELLEKRDITVEYAIHPVAGRMPGHMNVLLAEANVPYEQLKEMDEINNTFAQTDVTIVIGANDVVNPLARTDPESPIAGMPILDVDKSRTVVVVKRSLSPGFAGIANPLFAADNCLMLFGDGRKALLELIAAVKEG
jgi:NAD(P) transhydrogenase subunit beta